eukprot:Gb_04894 [translate_table: standard]
MATIRLVAFCRSNYNHFCSRLKYHQHNYIRLIHLSTSVAVEQKPTPKKNGVPQCNNADSIFRGPLFKDSKINTNTYASLLQEYSNIKRLKQLHAHMLISGFAQNKFLVSKLVSMYAMCCSMEYARLVFDKIDKPNVFLWNVMIRGYATNGPYEKSITLYYQMQLEGIQPDKFTFPCVLKACASLSDLQEGEEIHDDIVGAGFESDVFVANSLVAMYAKCGSVELARHVFDKMSERNLVSWNAMLAGYAQNEYADEALAIFNQMQLADVAPDAVTMLSVLQACAHLGVLQQGKLIHDYIIQNGFDSDVCVGNSLVAMYAKCGSTEIARQLFNKMPKRNVVSWSAMIAGCAQNGHANEAFTLFHQMQLAGIIPNSVTMINVLQACAHLGALEQGIWIHGYIIRKGFESEVFVANSLIDMYAKCGSVEIARNVFDKMSKRNVVSWSSLLAGYAQSGYANEALALIQQMRLTDVKSNSVTMVSLVQSYTYLATPQQGKWVHGYIIKNGFEFDVFVVNSLIDMYSKCGSTEVAWHLFDRMSKKDVVSWNAMIVVYAQNGYAREALSLFNQMQLTDVKPDMATILSVLPACAHLAALQQGKWIHGYIIRSGFESYVSVGNSLIDMYAKCGSVQIARHFFDKMSERNVVSWNAMIAGYGMHGHGEDALRLFSQMQQMGMKANNVTFVCVLSACSHAGLVDEGRQYFYAMIQDYCVTPRMEHYACMVDLLGRAGCLDEARDFIEKMPLEPGANVWGALLSACRIHCNIELGEYVAKRLFVLEPENAGCYVLLSNIYAAAGRWDDVAKVRTVMKDRGLKKTPGCSLIEVNNKVHAFFVGDRSHPQSEKIYIMLETLDGQMKAAGYVPSTKFVLHDVEDEVKEHMLFSHSEKLAIAFGLISTRPGKPILITKNLRVCGDCHSATKFISKIVKREITVRDANRYHHFKDGLCSCGDYW